ncbi:30S ribosomal protein S1 [Clostridium grantii]|uniref:Small subunit ribosomal protein S1 n=1 Tax=Clostridium grantii DSM 8605 TaxID=1121316 RepID=A0A1M5XSV2_9CLOT|nr:30S ribosomal protein S1 [Clostridium grantii]SHI02891.1 small subunit ribosomal protein S1 [Clostridium grantii DSM 8605]
MSEENINSMDEMMDEIEKSMEPINSGDIVTGKVISVSDSEVLVNIGFISDGVISNLELSGDSEVSAKEKVNVGDEISVYVVKVNSGEGTVVLSQRRAEAIKSWDVIESAVESEEIFEVEIKEAVKGGVVAWIKGIRAFIPASQLSVNFVKDLNEFVGKTLEVKVIEVDKEKNRVILSRKVIEQVDLEKKKKETWNSLVKGEKVTGTVTRIAKFGAFVDLGGVDGLIHVTQLSWERVKNVEDVVSVGDSVEVYILDLDQEKGKISLSLKDVKENPWKKASQDLKEGEILEGKIMKLAKFGAFVQIKPGVEGLVHISEISEERIADPSEKVNIGDKVKVKVLGIDRESNRISLSIKEAADNVPAEYQEFLDDQESEGTTLGDIFGDKLKDFFK